MSVRTSFGGIIMKRKKSGCKFAVQYNKTQIQCAVNGAICTVGKGCPCKMYQSTLWAKIKNIFTTQND